jgi:hypothetical protein
MACECIEKMEEKLINYLKEKEPQKTFTDGKFKNKTLLFKADPPRNQLYFELGYTETFTKKDGSASKPINRVLTVLTKYCSFCGKPFEEKTEKDAIDTKS